MTHVHYFTEREDKYKDIVHQNDVWHGGKNLAKKINAVSIITKCNEVFFI